MIQISTIHTVWQASSSYCFLSRNNPLHSYSASFSPPAHTKWELLRRIYSESFDSGIWVNNGIKKRIFCLHMWKYQEGLKVRKWLGLGLVFGLVGFFSLLWGFLFIYFKIIKLFIGGWIRWSPEIPYKPNHSVIRKGHHQVRFCSA